MPTDWGALYREHVDDLEALADDLADDLDDEGLARVVPATPGWTVHDVLAHLAGGPADFVVGRLDGAPGPEWTAAHVAERAHLPVAELFAELRSHLDWVTGWLGEQEVPGIVYDITVHHADVHEALGRGRLPEHLWRPVLEHIGPRQVPELMGRVDDYELFRAVFSRRSRAQMQAWGDGSGRPAARRDRCLRPSRGRPARRVLIAARATTRQRAIHKVATSPARGRLLAYRGSVPLPPSGRPTRRAPLVVLAVVACLALALPASGASGASGSSGIDARAGHVSTSASHAHARTKKDVRQRRELYVDPSLRAAHPEPAFAPVVRRAQPLWLTDYLRTPADAKRATQAYVRRAESAHRTPLLTVYNIPDRDCGAYSSQDDDITDAFYRSWVAQVAAGLRGSHPLVVLEPDAIAMMDNPACTRQGNRLALLRFATSKLTKAGAWVYLDAGHSGWRTPESMAPLLKRAGVAGARGVATNVAGTMSSADEATYARGLVASLSEAGVRGVKYVVDTSRNGAGRNGPTSGDYCNPTAARLGASPRLVFKGAFDGRLWVKRPGESDGTCNGGPSAGTFYPDGACRLQGRSAYDASTRRCR